MAKMNVYEMFEKDKLNEWIQFEERDQNKPLGGTVRDTPKSELWTDQCNGSDWVQPENFWKFKHFRGVTHFFAPPLCTSIKKYPPKHQAQPCAHLLII